MLVFNWSLPLAAYLDTKKSPELISPNMTLGLHLHLAQRVPPR
jgi:hypothetical protein